jgi:hypothetical protein
MPSGTQYLIEAGMLSDFIRNWDIDKDGTVDHYSFDIRNQFLHSVHPLAWFKKMALAVDGRPVDSKNMYFVLRGQWINVSKLDTITEIFWTIAEEARIYVCQRGGIAKGSHAVKFSLTTSSFTDTRFLDVKGLWADRTYTFENTMQTI